MSVAPRFKAGHLFETLSFWLFICALAWAPFPLGSNRPWSWSLLALLIAGIWLLWCGSIWNRPETVGRLSRGLLGPLVLAVLAVGWGIVQIVPMIPANWAHPIWRISGGIIGKNVIPTISLSPWRSETELMKFAIYAMAFWMARAFAGQKRAGDLISALIAIGACYAAYGFVLRSIGYSQFELFYGMPLDQSHDLAGPFVNHNNYATYEGLIALCAGGRLIVGGWSGTDGVGVGLFRVANYIFARGVAWLVAAALSFSAVAATGSGAGNLATWLAAAALLFMGAWVTVRQGRNWLGLALVPIVLVIVFVFLEMNGASLATRLNAMAVDGATDVGRLLLWKDAVMMIRTAPFTGWGLGTYQVVYPLFATATMPFVMDKAHNDYLELAAGWGLPAAIIWWTALLWLVVICCRSLFNRERNRLLPALAIGASILVGIHSVFDFSLQMPAVALTYATILGLGVGQALETHPRWQT